MYEVRLANGLGPLARSALGTVRAVSTRRGIRLTITCREPVPVVQLVRLLDRLGVDIEKVHVRRTGFTGWPHGAGCA